VTGLLVIAIGTQASGATGSAAGPLTTPGEARELTATPRVAPEKCSSARKAVRFYATRIVHWRRKMGQDGRAIARHLPDCPKFLAHILQRKAHAARKAYERWYRNEWHPALPAFDRAVAMCETQLNYRHHAGSYEGAWGWYHGTWLLDRPAGAPEHAYDATPRQQWEAFKRGWYVLHHYWGCIANGGYRYHL